MRDRQLAVLGVGLIGGSVGLAARRAGWRVVGHDPAVGQAAVAAGAVDRMADSVPDAVGDADLVVLAVPVVTAVRLVGSLGHGTAVVTDVGSTKRSVVDAAAAAAVRRFVGSHPMAGGDRGGVAHARADLLAGALCLLTPTAGTDSSAVATVESFWQSLGMRTARLDPADHDRLIADVSHVPHVAAAAVVRQATADAIPLAAGGWRDTTRVAGGDPDLWRDILVDNRANVAPALRRLRDDLDDLVRHLDAADAAAVREWLSTAADVRRGIG